MWFRFSERKIVELFAISEDPDQMPHSAASILGLHCLPDTLLGVSRPQCVNSVTEIETLVDPIYKYMA